MPGSDKVDYKLWAYTPSLVGGVIAALSFVALSCFHAFSLIKNRTWFCLPFVIGGLLETIGYSARAVAHSDTETLAPYITQSILILIAPILFAASIYMILGRIILRTDSASLSIVRAIWVTKIFVTSDILCFCIQSGGAGILASADDRDTVSMGENVVLGGLILQILIFGFFVLVAGVWHRRLATRPMQLTTDIPWTKYIKLLYAASILITVRNACRVAEYAGGRDGYLITHEWPLYMYDFLMMIFTLVFCVAWYDPDLQSLPKKDAEMALLSQNV